MKPFKRSESFFSISLLTYINLIQRDILIFKLGFLFLKNISLRKVLTENLFCVRHFLYYWFMYTYSDPLLKKEKR